MSQATVERADNREHQRRIRQRSGQARLLDLAEHLPDPERLLVRQVYDLGQPASDVARLIGLNRRTLQHRLAGLIRRMRHPTYRLVAEKPELIPPETHVTARRVVLHGQTLRTAAAQSNRSLHRVRLDMQALYTLTRQHVGPVHRPVGAKG